MYLALGDKEQAIDEMERAYRERDANVAQIRTDPMLDEFRGKQRFEALGNQIGAMGAAPIHRGRTIRRVDRILD
jgi:hypothetical protein